MENLLENSVEPMTKFGYERLQAEANHLKLEVRPAVIKAIEEAADMGDLKENAEYHAGKEQQVNIDRRLQEVSDLLSNAQIVDPSELEHARVSFGSTVVLEDINSGEEVTYTIVGGCESNPEIGLISFNSPLAKQILGKEEGDEIKVRLPGGVKEFEVAEVKYQEIVFECHD
jgi:transcription elongation factor GreA